MTENKRMNLANIIPAISTLILMLGAIFAITKEYQAKYEPSAWLSDEGCYIEGDCVLNFRAPLDLRDPVNLKIIPKYQPEQSSTDTSAITLQIFWLSKYGEPEFASVPAWQDLRARSVLTVKLVQKDQHGRDQVLTSAAVESLASEEQ